MKSIIKPLFILALMALSVFSYAQEPEQSQESTTYVENEFIIWLEQDVDAADFAAKSNTGIMPKRQLSKRLNIWLFEINDNKELREDKMRRLNANADVRVIQNNHTITRSDSRRSLLQPTRGTCYYEPASSMGGIYHRRCHGDWRHHRGCSHRRRC